MKETLTVPEETAAAHSQERPDDELSDEEVRLDERPGYERVFVRRGPSLQYGTEVFERGEIFRLNAQPLDHLLLLHHMVALVRLSPTQAWSCGICDGEGKRKTFIDETYLNMHKVAAHRARPEPAADAVREKQSALRREYDEQRAEGSVT